ncbi:MAG: hypothetical protein EOO75_06200 [Myxococcales bacterium]|nr:MAG: hypothetical protein EOO75_06200 [Myxococcales bacterium]
MTGLWNVWHVLQQRYGILRAYGVKARGGLESPRAGGRDRGLVWALALLTAALTLLLRGDSMGLHPRAQALWRAVGPLLDRGGRWALIAIGAAAAGLIGRWAVAEVAATPSARAPRLLFVASTVALCGVFVVHGPVVGYLCFGAAHAIEYLAFVHHVGEGRHRAGARPGLAARFLRRPQQGALLLVGGLGLAYVLLQPLSGADLYVTYYVATSLLHYLYDGWIWRGPRSA